MAIKSTSDGAILINHELLYERQFANIDYLINYDKWQLISDVYSDLIISEPEIFNRNIVLPYQGKDYSGDMAKAVSRIQSQFFLGADFTNVLARTVNVMVGAVRLKDNDLKLGGLESISDKTVMMRDIKQTILDAVLYSRCGLLTSAPMDGEQLTMADVEAGKGAKITTYHAWQIVDWETDENGRDIYVLLAEPERKKSIDQFGWGVLELKYRLIYRDEETDAIRVRKLDASGAVTMDEPVTNADGTPAKIFPFQYVGAFVNSAKVNKPATFAIAKKNVVLLTYSAYANLSMRMYGSPIMYLAPNEQMQDDFSNEITAGGLTGYNVGQGGSVGFAQPQANTLATAGKEQLIDELVKMGARLVVDGAANQTAEAAMIQHSGDMSMLQSVVNNVSMAYTKALRLLADYNGIDYSTDPLDEAQFIGLEIDDKVIDSKAEATMIQALNAGVSGGTMPAQALFKYLQETRLISGEMTFEEFQGELNAGGLNLNG